MAEQLNVSFVGCGGMAAHYLNVYDKLDWVRVSSCIDIQQEIARQAAATFQRGSPLATTEFAAALDDNVDVVVINTPNSQHAPQAIAAIERGKHVLLQKPVSANLEDARKIANAAQLSSRTVGLYMSYFDQPLMHDLRHLIRQGHLGDVVHCYARLMHRGGMMWSKEALAGKRTWRGSLQETGGGCFIQLAVHYLHLFEWATGAQVTRASAFTQNIHCPGLEGEDLACAVLQMNSGAMITLDTAWCASGEELAVHGTGGRVQYRSNRRLSVALHTGAFEGHVVRYSGALTEAFGGPEGEEQESEVRPPPFGDVNNPFNQHRLFLEAARDGKPAPVSIESGVRDMEIVAAVYESARSGQAVDVD